MPDHDPHRCDVFGGAVSPEMKVHFLQVFLLGPSFFVAVDIPSRLEVAQPQRR